MMSTRELRKSGYSISTDQEYAEILRNHLRPPKPRGLDAGKYVPPAARDIDGKTDKEKAEMAKKLDKEIENEKDDYRKAQLRAIKRLAVMAVAK